MLATSHAANQCTRLRQLVHDVSSPSHCVRISTADVPLAKVLVAMSRDLFAQIPGLHLRLVPGNMLCLCTRPGAAAATALFALDSLHAHVPTYVGAFARGWKHVTTAEQLCGGGRVVGSLEYALAVAYFAGTEYSGLVRESASDDDDMAIRYYVALWRQRVHLSWTATLGDGGAKRMITLWVRKSKLREFCAVNELVV